MSTPSTFARVRRAALAAVVPLTLLAGCSDNPEPKPMPSPAASATPTDEPSASPVAAPVLPPEARENTPEGAEAFVRHWIAAFNFGSETGDVAMLRALSSTSCDVCRGITDSMARVHSAGGTVDGGQWRIQTVNAVRAPGDRFSVDTHLTVEPQEVIESPGSEPVRFKGGERYRVFTVDFDSGWLVLDIEEPA